MVFLVCYGGEKAIFYGENRQQTKLRLKRIKRGRIVKARTLFPTFINMWFSNLALLVEIILRDYFGNDVIFSRCLIIFSEIPHADFRNTEIPFIFIKINRNYSTIDWDLIFNYHGCQSIVIQVENPAELITEFESRIKSNMERFNHRRYLIVPSLKEIHEINANFDKIYKIESLEHIADLLVVNPEPDSTENDTIFNLETHKFVGISDNNQKLHVDRWFSKNSSFLNPNSNLYPKKLKNLQGRPFYLGTFLYPPYSIPKKDLDEFYGSELKTISEFVNLLNMTPVLVLSEIWGELDNGTSTGILGTVNNGSADVGFGALYTWAFCYDYLDLSKPIVRTGITCLVPGPDLAASWLTPLLSFSTTIWAGVGLVFISAIVTLGLSEYYYKSIKNKNKKSYLNYLALSIMKTWKPFLMQSLTRYEIPKFEFCSKLIIFLILVFSLFLTSSYSSGFSSIMTVPRYVAINSVQELAESGLEWAATEEAWIMSIKAAKEPNYVKILQKFRTLSAEEMRELSFGKELGFSIERLTYDNFAIGDYIRGDVIDNYHLMAQDIYWEYCVYMLRKSSIFLPSLDLFILRVMQSGLSSIWQNEAVVKFMQEDVQSAVKFYKHRKSEHKVVKLKWSHVEGAFAILMIGNCLSLIAFFVELLSGKFIKHSSKG